MKNDIEKTTRRSCWEKKHEHSCNFLLINLEKKMSRSKTELRILFLYNKDISNRTFACSNWGFSENLTEITFHNNKLDKSVLQRHFQWIWRSKVLGDKNQTKKECSRKKSVSILWKIAVWKTETKERLWMWACRTFTKRAFWNKNIWRQEKVLWLQVQKDNPLLITLPELIEIQYSEGV